MAVMVVLVVGWNRMGFGEVLEGEKWKRDEFVVMCDEFQDVWCRVGCGECGGGVKWCELW